MACLFVFLGSATVFANEPPSMANQYVTTYRDREVTFLIRAADPDIDPLRPGDHPLTFVLVEGPSHGILIGDLAAVIYEGPHTAHVVLLYRPAKGFVGVDYVVLTVVDPLGLATTGTTTIQIDVVPRTEGTFSGSVDGWFTYDAQPGSLTAFSSRVTGVYRAGPLAVQGAALLRFCEPPSADIDETRVWFDTAEVAATARFDRLLVGAVLVLEPAPMQTEPTAPDYFDYALVSSGFSLFGASITCTLYIDHDAADSYQSVGIRTSVAGVRLSSMTLLSMDPACALAFSSERVTVDGEWCGTCVHTALTLTDAGLDELYVKLEDYAIPGLAHAGQGLFLDLTTQFSVDEKSVTHALSLKTRWVDCIRVCGEVVLGPHSSTWIDGASLYGLRIQQGLGDVKLESSTSFDPDKNAAMTGQVDYFELLRISGPTEPCCGTPGIWSVATYFQDHRDAILGWGMTVVKVDASLADSASASLHAAYRAGGFAEPKLELAFGWCFRW